MKNQVIDSSPIWVSGVYRSGTTFLSALIGAHPDVKSSSSTVKFLRFCLNKYGDLSVESNLDKLLKETNKRIRVRWNLSINIQNIKNSLHSNNNISYALVYDLIMKDMLKCNKPKDRWLEKLAVQWLDIPEFLDLFPNGKVVHTIRDPRDVMASYKHMTIEKGDAYIDAAFNCRSSMEFIYNLDKKYKDRVKVVKIENISNNVDSFIKDICNFLELDYSKHYFHFNNLHAAGEDWRTNTSYGKAYKSFPKPKSRWNSVLSREEIILTELVTQPYLSYFGYKSSEYFPTMQEWQGIYSILDDDFLKKRFENYLFNGKGSQGYKSDPVVREMKIAFPDRDIL
jgi:hypothetical protein